ncbi:MAG: N-acetylmuramoyl-L-alanine amidase, partial [Clostridiales bacterium]
VHRNLPVPALVALGLDDLTIVVDAGHGGADPGAVGVTGTLEKEVDLAIANRLADLLESSGVEVIQTREMDEMIAKNKTEDIHKRAEIACEAQANLFITVHANSIPQKNLQGAQVFYHPDSPEGCRLAGNIQDEIRRVMGNTNRKILAKNDIFLLNHLAIPAVLVEVGFLSNQEEEALLQDPEYQNRMAWCIYSGLVNFLAGDRNIMDSFVKDGESAGASIRMQ